ncbi:hypothetical protein [Caldithrix abyssi]
MKQMLRGDSFRFTNGWLITYDQLAHTLPGFIGMVILMLFLLR